MWGLQPEDLAGEPHVSAIVERSRPYFDQTEDWDRLKSRIVELAADRETRHGRIERPDGSELDFVSVPLPDRSEEHTSELQSLMRISYAVFCLKKKKKK